MTDGYGGRVVNNGAGFFSCAELFIASKNCSIIHQAISTHGCGIEKGRKIYRLDVNARDCCWDGIVVGMAKKAEGVAVCLMTPGGGVQATAAGKKCCWLADALSSTVKSWRRGGGGQREGWEKGVRIFCWLLSVTPPQGGVIPSGPRKPRVRKLTLSFQHPEVRRSQLSAMSTWPTLCQPGCRSKLRVEQSGEFQIIAYF